MAKAYEGDQPYIFVSYSHKDREPVMRCIEALQQAGYRVWFDGGIEVGSEWPEYIATHLAECTCVMAFISDDFVESIHCRQELALSQELHKEQLNIYLTRAKLSMGLRLQLGLHQAVFRDNFQTEEAFLSELCSARILEKCRELPTAVKQTPPPAAEPREETPAPAPVKEEAAPETPKNGFKQLEELLQSGKVEFASQEEQPTQAADFVPPPPPRTPAQKAAQAAFDKLCSRKGGSGAAMEFCYAPVSLLLMYLLTPWTGISWLLVPILFGLRLAISLRHRSVFQKLKKKAEAEGLTKEAESNAAISVLLSFLISTVISLIGGIFALRMEIFFLLRLLVAMGLNLLPFLIPGCITLLMDD